MLDHGTILGPYKITGLLGVGGMGEVYRAIDARLNREVAIKVLPSHLADDPASLERFRRETRAVAALSHPNILAIFDVGSEKGIYYAVTELLEGETLRARITRGPLAAAAALELMLQIAEGVAAAHERTIVHRDLKPENVFITTNGRVKVLDFGLARGASALVDARLASAPTEMLPTQPGIVMGTIGYIAPEQIKAQPSTPATDVFALGCILFELISGRVPFERPSSAHSMVALVHDSAPRLTYTEGGPMRAADAIVQKCLEKDPERRYHDAGELANALRAALAGERIPMRSTIPWRLVSAALALLVLASVAYFIVASRNQQIDHGYDIRASDIRGDRETRRLLALALRADAEGNRAKAAELLEEAWRRPSNSAFPPAFLSSFNDAAGNKEVANRWSSEAMRRLKGASSYESLLVRYLTTLTDEEPSRELALAKSALEVRPDAWRLRLAAAHIHLSQRDRDAALRELRRIDIGKLDDRRLMLVLADRASLGDVEGARRDLRASSIMQRPALRHYTEARFAWSSGDVRKARELYELAARDAAAEGFTQIEVESRMLAGACDLKLRDWSAAQRHLALATARTRQTNLSYRGFQCAALAAYAAHQMGDAEERDRKLRDAYAQLASHPGVSPITRVLALRLRSNVWQQHPLPPPHPQMPGVTALVLAREAWFRGEEEDAKRQLRRARAEGIETTEMHEEAELLAAELGLPSQILPADPPYPNIVRFTAIFDHERISGR